VVLDDSFTKKSLGQHWLFDDSALDSIADSVLSLSNSEIVLEIGPGLGTLTAKLIEAGRKVHAVEFDHDLAQNLRARVEERLSCKVTDELVVTEHDILTFNLSNLPKDYSVCANIPYYLTSKLLRILSESSNPPAACALLIQKEVAERVCAEAGQTSMLSISTQFYFETHLGDLVPAKLFTPAPKVDSQVLILVRRTQPLFQVNEKQYFRVIKAGFSERRKTLRNSLSGGLHITKEQVEQVLEVSRIKPTARAQELTHEQWYALYQNVLALSILNE
jgi:16S rRNA (adenine1518-N6/adenine1519-N6)-dimethyltransferase